MKSQNKPIVWILGIVLVVLLISQTGFFSNLGLFSSIDHQNECTIGEMKCCNTPNVYCIDSTDDTGRIQFKCEQSTTGGIWVNRGYRPTCVSNLQSCTTGEKCMATNYITCQNNLWTLKGITAGKCGVPGTFLPTPDPTPPTNPKEPQDTEPEETKPEGTITIPIINLQVTTAQAAVGGVSLLLLIFLFL